MTIQCDQDIDDLTLTGDVTTADDSCDPNSPTSTYVDVVDSEPCGGSAIIIRTWTVTDDCGNSVSDSQTITVEDNTAPTFTVPNDIVIECNLDPNDLAIVGDVTDEADHSDPSYIR